MRNEDYIILQKSLFDEHDISTIPFAGINFVEKSPWYQQQPSRQM